MNTVPVKRSRFVSGLAWMVIVFAALTLLLILDAHFDSGGSDPSSQLFGIGGLDSLDDLKRLGNLDDDDLTAVPGIESMAAMSAKIEAALPAPVRWILDDSGASTALNLLVQVASVAFGIGMLRRKHWGRVGVIAVIWFTIAAAVLASLAAIGCLPAIDAGLASLDAESRSMIHHVMVAVVALLVVLAIVHCAIAAWLIWKLKSPPILAEFA